MQLHYKDKVLKGSSNISSGDDNYSEEEQVIGKWIDGKPLYRKSVSGEVTFSQAASSTVEFVQVHDVINVPDIDKFTALYGNIYSGSNMFGSSGMITKGSEERYSVYIGGYSASVRLVVRSILIQSSAVSTKTFNLQYNITAEYTKSTDVDLPDTDIPL